MAGRKTGATGSAILALRSAPQQGSVCSPLPRDGGRSPSSVPAAERLGLRLPAARRRYDNRAGAPPRPANRPPASLPPPVRQSLGAAGWGDCAACTGGLAGSDGGVCSANEAKRPELDGSEAAAGAASTVGQAVPPPWGPPLAAGSASGAGGGAGMRPSQPEVACPARTGDVRTFAAARSASSLRTNSGPVSQPGVTAAPSATAHITCTTHGLCMVPSGVVGASGLCRPLASWSFDAGSSKARQAANGRGARRKTTDEEKNGLARQLTPTWTA